MPDPHTLFEVTCRTLQGRFLLRPSAELNDRILGIMGRALGRYPVSLYLFVVASNHMHLIVSAPNTKILAFFMCYLNGNLAKEAGRLYAWKEKFWGRRYTAIPILDDESLWGRVRYLLSHGCKENLVARPGDWPGLHCVNALTDGETLQGAWIDRTKAYEASMRNEAPDRESLATAYEVPLTVLPCLAGLAEQEQRRIWRELIADIEAETRARLAREKRNVLGRIKVLAMHPHRRPEQPNKSPQPVCHAAAQATVKLYLKSYYLFVELYRLAVERWEKEKWASSFFFPQECRPGLSGPRFWHESLAPG